MVKMIVKTIAVIVVMAFIYLGLSYVVPAIWAILGFTHIVEAMRVIAGLMIIGTAWYIAVIWGISIR